MASESNLSVDRRFQELCTHMRATDDISFKLLSVVPLISGAGFAVVFLKAEPRLSALVFFISIFAAVVTLALFCWERRNIQTCLWLRDRMADLEKSVIDQKTRGGHVIGFPSPALGIGKTIVEKVVYSATILAWLALPWFIDVRFMIDGKDITIPSWLTAIHRVSLALIGAATLLLVLLPVEDPPKTMKETIDSLKRLLRVKKAAKQEKQTQ